MALYKDLQGYSYTQGVKLNKQLPIDLRTIADTYADLAKLPTSCIFEGLQVYIKDTDKRYTYRGSAKGWVEDGSDSDALIIATNVADAPNNSLVYSTSDGNLYYKDDEGKATKITQSPTVNDGVLEF